MTPSWSVREGGGVYFVVHTPCRQRNRKTGARIGAVVGSRAPPPRRSQSPTFAFEPRLKIGTASSTPLLRSLGFTLRSHASEGQAAAVALAKGQARYRRSPPQRSFRDRGPFPMSRRGCSPRVACRDREHGQHQRRRRPRPRRDQPDARHPERLPQGKVGDEADSWIQRQ